MHPRHRVAVWTALIGALAVAVAPALAPARTVHGPGPGGAIWPAAVVVALCAFAPGLLAALALRSRRASLGAGLLAGSGAVAVGLTVLDVQLLVGPIDANRLELLRPLTAAHLSPGPGAVVVLVGHLLAVAAGLVALSAARRLDDQPMPDREPDGEEGRAVGAQLGSAAVLAVSVAAAVAVVGLFGAALTSSDPVVLTHSVVDAPYPVAFGTVAVVAGLLLVVAMALVTCSRWTSAGALTGAGLGVLQLSGGRLTAGLGAGDRIGVSAATVWSTVAAVALVVIGLAIPVVADLRDRAVPAPVRAGNGRAPSIGRAHRVAGLCGLVTAVVAVVGAVLPVLRVSAGLPEPRIYATRVELAAGVLLAIVAVWLLLSEYAVRVRPVLAVVWTVPLLGATAVLESVVFASDVPGVGLGPGAFAAGLVVIGAVTTGVAAGMAGAAERSEIDTSVDPEVDRPGAVVTGIGAAAAVVSLVLPLYTAPDVGGRSFAAAWIGHLPWGWDVWGQVVTAVAIASAALVAARARPARGAALSAGCTIAVIGYLATGPLTWARVPDHRVGPAMFVGALAVVGLGAGAVMAGRRAARGQ
ncbi:hypothetical protein G4X40_18905 [Rhodococcus sp. D2-41]|uniref:hypothetical protein n=1 Tax=Speluncibacter jeojiensis TaxID=2710754 RepID=UPI0024106530|nr:hypothetical protein [Rhodococcus sp. D2-41]MDG3012214.1 hypothetical protein [Rhodococcus sp. D2-41]